MRRSGGGGSLASATAPLPHPRAQTFDETASTADVYHYVVQPLVGYAFERRGRGTVLAYGQTGSGKTHTIAGLHELVARDVFRALASEAYRGRGLRVCVSMLEIHGGRCADLLHGRARVAILEDERKRVVCAGLAEVDCASPDALLAAVARGAAERATAATEANAASSRSHAVCEIVLRGRLPGAR